MSDGNVAAFGWDGLGPEQTVGREKEPKQLKDITMTQTTDAKAPF